MKMSTKLVTLCVIFAVVAAEPIPSGHFGLSEGIDESQELSKVLPDFPYLLFDIVKSIIGVKFSALSLGVFVIEWVLSNSLVIVIGAAVAVGLCKITGKCHLEYEDYTPVAQLKNFITPENLQFAEKFFVSAMEKYAEKKRRAVTGQPEQ